MRFPVRRIVLGFVVGAGAGWVASLLRRPQDAPAGTGADAAEHMPQEEFGDLPAGEPPGEPGEPALEGADEIAQEPTAPPRKAVPEMVTPPPGRGEHPEPAEAAAEPAKPAKPAAKAAKPAKRTRAKKAAEPVALVAEPVSEAVREGRSAMNEALDSLDVTPPEATVDRRRRRT